MGRRTRPRIDLEETVEALARAIRAHRGGVLNRVRLVDLAKTAGLDSRMVNLVAERHAQLLYQSLGRWDGKSWVPEFTDPVYADGTISCQAIVNDQADDSTRNRQPALTARAWRMLLHASVVDDELHVFEPWTRKGSRVPSLEASLVAARLLIERGLCQQGTGPAWVQITADGSAFVEAQRERYAMMYPYVSLDAAGETVEQT